jgi:hypothetical protein
MIFTCVTAGVAVDARQWLSGFDDFLGAFRMQDWQVVDRNEEVGANWKVCYDGTWRATTSPPPPRHHLQDGDEQRHDL